jgi:hypothetical protein
MSAYEDAMAAGAVALGRRRSQRPKRSGSSLELGLAGRIDFPVVADGPTGAGR